MNKPVVVFIVVLVAIVALFAVGVGAGVVGSDDEPSASELSRPDEGGDDGGSGLLGRLRDLAGGAADADLASMAAGCPDLRAQPPVLTFTGSCEITVAASSERIRLVRLVGDRALDVTAPAPEGDLDEIESEVDPGKEITIPVGPNGAGDDATDDPKDAIELDCIGIGATCTVAVLNGR